MMMNQDTPNPSQPVQLRKTSKRGSLDCDIHHDPSHYQSVNVYNVDCSLIIFQHGQLESRLLYTIRFNQTGTEFIDPGSSNVYNGSQTSRYTQVTIFFS